MLIIGVLFIPIQLSALITVQVCFHFEDLSLASPILIFRQPTLLSLFLFLFFFSCILCIVLYYKAHTPSYQYIKTRWTLLWQGSLWLNNLCLITQAEVHCSYNSIALFISRFTDLAPICRPVLWRKFYYGPYIGIANEYRSSGILSNASRRCILIKTEILFMSACYSPDPRIVEEEVGKVLDSFTYMNQQRMKQLNFTNLMYTLEIIIFCRVSLRSIGYYRTTLKKSRSFWIIRWNETCNFQRPLK